MDMNPYSQQHKPRTHAGAQALINRLTQTPEPLKRLDAQQLIMDTGLSAKTADNIILKLNGVHTISIIGRKRPSSGVDNRKHHKIRRGTRWNES